MTFKNLIVKKEEEIATIILNRPKALNAINLEVAEELEAAIKNLENDGNIKVVVLTGAGRAFCSGGDLKAIPTGKEARVGRDFLKKMHKWVISLKNLNKPVIAAVNGLAVGAGCNLALLADVIIASEKAKFSESFVKVGAIPDLGGMYLLPRYVGLAKAKELIFTGDVIDAREAEKIGLINKVVPHEKLEDAVKDLAQKLAKAPPMVLAMAKAIIHRGLNADFDTVLELEACAQGICFESKDHREGVRAFLEKRKPRFEGK